MIAHAYSIRRGTDADARTLRRLSDLDLRAPLALPVLIGEIAGAPVAALSLLDGRVVADPFQRTDHLVASMRARARVLRSHAATPSLRDRVAAALAPARRAAVAAAGG